MTPTWTLILAVGAPTLTLLGALGVAVIGAWAGRRAALKQADAAIQQAAAAALEAQAEMRRAVVAEREQASANWARFCDANDRQIQHLREDVASNTQRLAQSDMRAAAADLRASKAEQLYTIAIIYLHSLAAWATDQLPGVTLPPPPTELLADLARFGGIFRTGE